MFFKMFGNNINKGYCCICEDQTNFVIYDPWLRDNYKCMKCGTIPRHRALVNALNKFTPEWMTSLVHEGSPHGEFSKFLKRSCKDYSSSHFYSDISRGGYKGDISSQDLSSMTFPDASFDIFLTSDVFEHIYHAERAFGEIARVLKPGGAHIFTIPWYPQLPKTAQRVRLLPDGSEEYVLPPDYHGNPIGDNRSIVTFDYGSDIGDLIFRNGGMGTTVYLEIDRKKGLDGDFLEVFVSRKPLLINC